MEYIGDLGVDGKTLLIFLSSKTCLSQTKIITTCMSVTVDGVWIGN
jgi:hypothetical protein